MIYVYIYIVYILYFIVYIIFIWISNVCKKVTKKSMKCWNQCVAVMYDTLKAVTCGMSDLKMEMIQLKKKNGWDMVRLQKQTETCKKFVPRGITVNSGYYKKLLQRLWDDVWRKRLEKWAKGYFFHHENVPCHIPLLIRKFLAEKKTFLSGHIRFNLPDLGSSDFLITPRKSKDHLYFYSGVPKMNFFVSLSWAQMIATNVVHCLIHCAKSKVQ